MKLRLFVVLATACVLVPAAPAAAQELADATCPGPATSNRGNGPVPGAGNARFAQTFTVKNTGTLTTVRLGVVTGGVPADWIVQILGVSGGVPVDGVLSSATIDDAGVPVSGEITAHPSPPLAVAPGQQYALTVTRPGSDGVGVSTVTGDPCPGDFFFTGAPPDIFAPEPTNEEMVFAAFVTPPAAPQSKKSKKCKKRRKGKRRSASTAKKKKKRCKKKRRRHR